jgi:hypothetical protein
MARVQVGEAGTQRGSAAGQVVGTGTVLEAGRRRSAAAGRALIRRWQESGLRAAEFCRRARLAPHIFYYWKRRAGPSAARRPEGGTQFGARSPCAARPANPPGRRPGGGADGAGVRWVEARPLIRRAGPEGREAVAGDRDRRSAEVPASTGGTADAAPGWLALRLRNGRELRFAAGASAEAVRRWAEVLEQDARPC